MKLLNYCKNHAGLVIYGAGERGRDLLIRLKEEGFRVSGFLVSDPRECGDVNGLPVRDFSSWVQTVGAGVGVLVAVSRDYRDDIIQSLVASHWDDFLYVDDDVLAEFCRETHPVDPASFLSKTMPVSRLFGYDRGIPIDRYYIEKFLQAECLSLRNVSRTIEVGESTYSERYMRIEGGQHDVLDYGAGMDLTKPESLPKDVYDLFICTQVFNFIYDVKAAIRGAFHLLKDKGSLLATVAGNISQVSRSDMEDYGHFWGFTYLAIQRLTSEVFGEKHVRVIPFGNSMAATAFIQGAAVEDLKDRSLLDVSDPDYAICIGIVATKTNV